MKNIQIEVKQYRKSNIYQMKIFISRIHCNLEEIKPKKIIRRAFQSSGLFVIPQGFFLHKDKHLHPISWNEPRNEQIIFS